MRPCGETLSPKLILQRKRAVFSVLHDFDGGAPDGIDFDTVDCIAYAKGLAVDDDRGIFVAVENGLKANWLGLRRRGGRGLCN